jgi:hypothetical protein
VLSYGFKAYYDFQMTARIREDPFCHVYNQQLRPLTEKELETVRHNSQAAWMCRLLWGEGPRQGMGWEEFREQNLLKAVWNTLEHHQKVVFDKNL